MGYKIFLTKDADIGRGCSKCRFCINDKCLADDRVDTHKESGELRDHTPYACPFRYFDSEIPQITKQLHGMTEEETKGWFRGANHEHKKYVQLEQRRDAFVESQLENTDTKGRNENGSG